MEYINCVEKHISLQEDFEREKLEKFLEKQNIHLDKYIEYTIEFLVEDKIIGTGSIWKNTLRCIAVDQIYRGSGIINKIISRLIQKEHELGNYHLFVYTKPENIKSFKRFDFNEIITVDSKISLLEYGVYTIKDYVKDISKRRKYGKAISAIVVNCNPFTLGHKYLIETAAINSDYVHVFVVSEDSSQFPTEIRYKLVKEGVSHLKNVILHKAQEYIISNATFPSYFIEDKNEVSILHAKLDINIFGRYICNSLGINKRFIGEEPYSNVTNIYNQVMKKILPGMGICVEEIKRKKINGEIISASKVRKLLKMNNLIHVKKLVTEETYKFLLSNHEKYITKK